MLDFYDFIAIISYSSSLHLPPHFHSLSLFNYPKGFIVEFLAIMFLSSW